MKKTLPTILGALAIYLFSTGLSYAFFSWKTTPVETVKPVAENITPGNGFKIDQSQPKTEVCPLNGKLYTKQEKSIWEKRRPLAVMIENHTEARPQSGLSRADIVYEAVAEGGITRFMGVFYCGIAEETDFAPVRSARTYYVDWVSEYDALYNHVGGAGQCNDPTVDERAKALCQIQEYGIKDMDQFGISFPHCYRNPDRLDHPVATEHQMVCLSNDLYDIAKDRSWTNVDKEGVSWDENFTSWKFKKEEEATKRGATSKISFEFWPGYKEYDVAWDYDKVNNVYKRSNGGAPHLDQLTGQQIAVKNVVIEFVDETGPVDEHKHMLYDVIGTGKALVFQDGNVIKGTWKKAKRTSRTVFYDANGKEITFNPGEIWIEAVPSDNKITY